jgi:hypothetical protein
MSQEIFRMIRKYSNDLVKTVSPSAGKRMKAAVAAKFRITKSPSRKINRRLAERDLRMRLIVGQGFQIGSAVRHSFLFQTLKGF